MQSNAPKSRVLIVEDDENQRALYEEELADEGYEIITAADGREALQIVKENRPDLVVTRHQYAGYGRSGHDFASHRSGSLDSDCDTHRLCVLSRAIFLVERRCLRRESLRFGRT